jgi:large subunit ribosomal protein L10
VERAQKVAAVERMNEGFKVNPHIILASFRGLTVNQANVLRHRVREAGGSYTVIKNRLAKLAAAETPAAPLIEQFSGPCALAMHADDPVLLAKTLSDFAKENPQLELLAGVVDAKDVIDASGVKQLAGMPGLPDLRAQLLALVQTPATTLVRLLGTPGTQVARVLDAKAGAEGGADDGAEGGADAGEAAE